MRNYWRIRGPWGINGTLINKVLNPKRASPGIWLKDLVALFLPRRCAGCDTGLMRFEEVLCLKCLNDLPRTRHLDDPANRVEQLFWGKCTLQAAGAFLYFTPGGMVQRMLHRLKYHHDKEVGLWLGRSMAMELMTSARFDTVDLLMAVPLHPRKERQRGYNQSQVLVEGMRQAWPLATADRSLMRIVRTTTQTRKGRLDRWRNVKEAFEVGDPGALAGRHVLLVDDVVTTGATLEGCIAALSAVPDLRISVCTVACA